MRLRGFLLFALVVFFADRSYGAPLCPTDTVANVVALGSCTIEGIEFTFGPPTIPGHQVWDTPPYVGNSVLGPSSTQVTFTPQTGSAPGFNLSGDFGVNGGFSCKFVSSICGNGNLADAQFGYFRASAPAGMFFTGSSLDLFGADVTQGASSTDANWDNLVLVSLTAGESLYGYISGSGDIQLNDSAAFSPVSELLALALFRTWNRSGDPSSVAEFSSVTFSFDLNQPQVEAVSEPASLLLLGSGLVAGLRRWRKKVV